MKRTSQVLDVTPVNETELCDLLHCTLGDVSADDVVKFLSESGFSKNCDDTRLNSVFTFLDRNPKVSIASLTELKRSHLLLQKALHSDLAIPNFPDFVNIVTDIFTKVSKVDGGTLPTYIPQLAKVNPNLWGLSVCTVDGQRFSIGDCKETFSVQSVCKPINYAIAIDSIGVDSVHKNVGMEPSGRNFNERVLLPSGIPHNPLINTGAIMTTSLLFPESARWQRFEKVTKIWNKLGTRAGLQVLTSTYLAEREAGNRNYCLAHMIAEESSGAFPHDSKKIEALLDDYFAFCSLGVTTDEMAVVAATLANGGLNPISEESAISSESATCTLSVMMTCGMYDASGEFSATSGFPAKSGVSGIIIAVIPGVGGICTYSPLIDSLGNSVRGLEFFKQLAAMNTTTGSLLPIQTAFGNQFTWRVSGAESVITKLTLKEYSSLWWSAWFGDEQRIRQLAARGINVNETNYSNRTALNCAISNPNISIAFINLMIQLGACMSEPFFSSYLEDANRVGRTDIVELLLQIDTSLLSPRIPTPESPNTELPHGPVTIEADPTILRFLTPPRQFSDAEVNTLPLSKIPVHRYFTLANGLTLRKAVSACGLDPEVPFNELHTRALCGKLVVPNWPRFVSKLSACLEPSSQEDTPTRIAVVSTDGQFFESNNTGSTQLIGRIVRVVLYEIAIAKLGFADVHALIGKEPSGQSEDSLRLNSEGIPYNPLTLSGCLTVCHLLLTKLPLGEVLLMVRARLGLSLTGTAPPESSETTKCLVHLLGSKNEAIVDNGSIILELYESAHSILVDLPVIARYAKSLASQTSSVLSILFSCGMDELSGEWSFRFGLPAKSSGTGIVMVVVPGIMGYAVESNCWEFQTKFDAKFNVHMFKRHFAKANNDPTLYYGTNKFLQITQFLNSCSLGDLSTMKNLLAQGLPINSLDQDGRTALHVASGNAEISAWLLAQGADPRIEDPHSGTPTSSFLAQD